MKLTPAKRRLLEYVRKSGVVIWWPINMGSATRKRCEAEGLIERAESETMMVAWQLTAKGAEALK